LSQFLHLVVARPHLTRRLCVLPLCLYVLVLLLLLLLLLRRLLLLLLLLLLGHSCLQRRRVTVLPWMATMGAVHGLAQRLRLSAVVERRIALSALVLAHLALGQRLICVGVRIAIQLVCAAHVRLVAVLRRPVGIRK